MSLKLINTNNYGKETVGNLKSYIWNKKNVNLVIKFLAGEVSNNRSVGMGKGKGG